MGVVYQLLATQSVLHAERGIARLVRDQARAVADLDPGLVDQFLADPRMPLPPDVAHLPRLRPGPPCDPVALHCTSPFEPASPAQLWPPAYRRTGSGLLVTLFDLVPLRFPDEYLRSAGERAEYERRCRFVAAADLVLCISAATARDAAELLDVPGERLAVVRTGVSPAFRPAAPGEPPGPDTPGVRPGFLLYTGGFDHRKNIDGLLTAYAGLPATVRREHQLVVVGKVPAAVAERVAARVADLGVTGDVVLTGLVTDAQLRALYRTAHLTVFPSLFEGLGLPVVEALACGTPVVLSRTSSLVELVTDERAFFDPADPEELRAVLLRVLGDDGLRATLREAWRPDEHTWTAAVRDLRAAYTRAGAA